MMHLSKRALALVQRALCMNKYRNQKVQYGTLRFDSKAEANRYHELVLMAMAGQIAGWSLKEKRVVPMAEARQQRIPLVVNGKLVTTYVADFVYLDLCRATDSKIVVEDYKGYKTEAYRLKAKLFEAVMGFPITEISYRRRSA
jgi:Protein of unknown function (DUF1064)